MITRKKKGCLITFLLAVGLLFFVQWLALQPNSRADFVREKIHLGMSTLEVESLIPTRRFYVWHFCSYGVLRSGEWKNVSREEFSDALKTPPPNQPQETELRVMFYGFGSRAVVCVHADGAGRVVSVERPKAGG